mmetsp:Transcript_9975/g.15070  ORF Transcript_9975/g.15070 Transcript_9975/m.15070 type:complete len:142 (-) Transcript_9975:1233-1658(-)
MLEKGLKQSQMIKANPLTQNFSIGKRGRPPNSKNKKNNLEADLKKRKLETKAAPSGPPPVSLKEVVKHLPQEVKKEVTPEDAIQFLASAVRDKAPELSSPSEPKKREAKALSKHSEEDRQQPEGGPDVDLMNQESLLANLS